MDRFAARLASTKRPLLHPVQCVLDHLQLADLGFLHSVHRIIILQLDRLFMEVAGQSTLIPEFTLIVLLQAVGQCLLLLEKFFFNFRQLVWAHGVGLWVPTWLLGWSGRMPQFLFSQPSVPKEH